MKEVLRQNRCYDPKWLKETKVKCKCGHAVHFFDLIPYMECIVCGRLIFRNKKCEYDYYITRKYKR